MSRRKQAVKRETIPDLRYSSEAVTRLINRVMTRGKKSTAQGVVYNAFKVVKKRRKSRQWKCLRLR